VAWASLMSGLAGLARASSPRITSACGYPVRPAGGETCPPCSRTTRDSGPRLQGARANPANPLSTRRCRLKQGLRTHSRQHVVDGVRCRAAVARGSARIGSACFAALNSRRVGCRFRPPAVQVPR
jgi:hypothetical protein